MAVQQMFSNNTNIKIENMFMHKSINRKHEAVLRENRKKIYDLYATAYER